jgi:hypothetical protein
MDATPPYPQAIPITEDNAPFSQPKETLLKKPIKENGCKDMSIAFGNATRSTSLNNFLSPSATKGTSSPGPLKQPITDDSVKSLIEYWPAIRDGRQVTLSKTEIRELKQVWSDWPASSSFPNSFISAARAANDKPVPREADAFMAVVRSMHAPSDIPDWMQSTAQFLKAKKEREKGTQKQI